jgi:hypothetical protein
MWSMKAYLEIVLLYRRKKFLLEKEGKRERREKKLFPEILCLANTKTGIINPWRSSSVHCSRQSQDNISVKVPYIPLQSQDNISVKVPYTPLQSQNNISVEVFYTPLQSQDNISVEVLFTPLQSQDNISVKVLVQCSLLYRDRTTFM